MKESLGQYITCDGKPISFRKWAGVRDVIVYLHGIESNSGWFSPFASQLNERGFTLYGIDRRGSGLNEDDRGDIRDYNTFLDDIDDALKFIREQNIGKKIYLMGICWGGLLAVNYIAKRKPDTAHGLLLLSPAIYRKIDLNFCIKAIAKIYSLFYPKFRFKIPIRDEMFTSSKRYLSFIKKDTMRLRALSCRFFNEILRMEQELSPINHKITVPVAVLLSGYDEIVDNDRVREWFKRLEANDKTIKVFNDLRHVMPFEDNIDPLVDFISDWIETRELSLESQSIKD